MGYMKEKAVVSNFGLDANARLHKHITPQLDLRYGGQGGYLPRLYTEENGRHFKEWLSSQHYIRRNVIPVVLDYPRFMDFLPDKEMQEYYKGAYKSLIELEATSIDGLKSSLSVETEGTEIGSSQEMIYEVTDVKREVSSLTMNFKERANKSITRYFEDLIRMSMMDPDTKRPTIADYINLDELGGIYSMEMYTGTVLFIEPDITHQKVVDAWLCGGMLPENAGERSGKKDTKSGGNTSEVSITWKHFTINQPSVHYMAHQILAGLSVIKMTPEQDIIRPYDPVVDPNLPEGPGFNSHSYAPRS